MKVVVGCDLGTMGTKAGVVRLDGTVLAEAFEEVPLRYPAPGLVEQDLHEIEASAHRTIRAAIDRSGAADDIAAVSLSGQMSGIGTIDSAFEPATHYDSWLDTRCSPVIDELQPERARITQLSGCPPTYSHGPKMRWWQYHQPEAFRRIHRFVTPSAFVASRLCDLPAAQAYIDRTHLHFSNLADNAASEWSEELISLLEIDRRVLPRIVAPTDVIGTVTQTAATATGIPAGTPVAAGAGDTSAAALGAGVVQPGVAFDLAGTASVFAVCVDQFAPDLEHHTMMATAGIVPDTWVSLAFINGGGLALRWFRDELAADLETSQDLYAALDERAGTIEPGAAGLLWYPHIQGRVLPPEPNARGAWIGLTSGHTKEHLFRSVLEGVAFEYARWASVVRAASGTETLREARALGGGAGSPLWNQIKADIVGMNWAPLARQECGVLGNALIAGAAAGLIDDLAGTAERWQSIAKTVRPDSATHESYRLLRSASDMLSERLGPVFDSIRTATAEAPDEETRRA